MKTNQRTGFFRSLIGIKDKSPIISRKKTGAEDELIVIRDVSTNKDYFLSVIDDFFYKEKEYTRKAVSASKSLSRRRTKAPALPGRLR